MYVLCCAKLLQSYLLFAILWNLAYQTPLSLGLSRQEYWSGLPRAPPGHLPNSGTEAVTLNISCIGLKLPEQAGLYKQHNQATVE